MSARRGQAILETVLAVLFVSFAFFFLFWLSRLLTAKILVQHAAMRVARARTVGMNEFMCLKTARLSVLPVSGRRIRPEDDTFTSEMELARFGNYLATSEPGIAAAVLDYEGWAHLKVDAGDGRDSTVKITREGYDFDLTGEAGIEANYTYYLNDQGR